MKQILFSCTVALSLLCGCENISQTVDAGAQISQALGYSPKQLNSGIKEALTMSVTRATDVLSEEGGYGSNSEYQLQLPSEIQKISDVLSKLGLNSQLTQVRALMNRGAELAAAEAKNAFLQGVKDMPITDGLALVRGGNTAVTDYFKAQMGTALTTRYREVLHQQLQKLGFYNQYQQLLQTYALLPIANKPALDLESYAATKGVDVLFVEVAEQEKRIRANPLQEGSALLAAIFSK